MTRITVEKVMKKTFELIFIPLCDALFLNTAERDKHRITNIIQRFKNQYKEVDTEKRLIKVLKEEGTNIEPEIFTIDDSNKLTMKQGLPYIMPVKITVIKSSIGAQFTKIFELPGVYQKLTEYSVYCKSIVKAIDMVFKICISLNLKYQFSVEPIWFFIQKLLYNINLKNDLKLPSVVCYFDR
jgi:hypothetical protein